MRRILPLFALAALMYVVGPALAEEKKAAAKNPTHQGRFVSAEGNKLTMTMGRDGKEHSHTVAADAKITCDGKECKLSDLKKGVFLRVTTKEGDPNTVVRIDAFTRRPGGGARPATDKGTTPPKDK